MIYLLERNKQLTVTKMSEQPTLNDCATLNEYEEISLCGYASELTHKGSCLRKCSISNGTSCEAFNTESAKNCFIKLNHENFFTNETTRLQKEKEEKP